MFETRFLCWGISRWILFFMGVLPVLFVAIFHAIPVEFAVLGLVLAVFWVFFMSRGYYRFSHVYFWTCLSGLTLELIFALREKNFVQMAAGIACVAVFLGLFHWLERQMNRAQHNPDVRWFEGLPQFLPRVKMEVFWNDKWYQASLRKIDHHGIFVFLQKSEQEARHFRLKPSMKHGFFPIKLQYRDHEFIGDARLRSVFNERWLGMGLQICPKDLYHFTQYSKIVQNLKGEGYAT